MSDFADLSDHQDTANIDAIRRGGDDRIVLKATEGATYTNRYYTGWAARCATLNLPFGAYHYATTADPDAQAAYFLGVVKAGHMPWWLIVDCEWDEPKNATAADGRHVADLVNRLVNRGAPTGWIYGSPAWINAAQLLPAMLPAGWRILWLASYGTSQLKVPAGWLPQSVAAWQYTNAALTVGVPTPCDRSRVMREWLPSGGTDMELAELDAAGKAPGKSGLIATIVGGCVAAETAVNAGNGARSDIAALKTLLSSLIAADHPAQNVITDPVGDLATRIGGLSSLADAARLLSALSTRISQLATTATS